MDKAAHCGENASQTIDNNPQIILDNPTGYAMMIALEDIMKEIVLYGKRADQTADDWREELLLTNATPELIEKVKALATKDGFHSFRVAEIDLSVAPDFSKTVKRLV